MKAIQKALNILSYFYFFVFVRFLVTGCVTVYIVQNGNGEYFDVIYWRTEISSLKINTNKQLSPRQARTSLPLLWPATSFYSVLPLSS